MAADSFFEMLRTAAAQLIKRQHASLAVVDDEPLCAAAGQPTRSFTAAAPTSHNLDLLGQLDQSDYGRVLLQQLQFARCNDDATPLKHARAVSP